MSDDHAARWAGLHLHHRKLITASAIDPAVGQERGYFTASKKVELEQLGFAPSQCRVPSLIIPLVGGGRPGGRPSVPA